MAIMSVWEKPVRHHKWADELEADAKAKKNLKVAKKAAKDEDHSKQCPYCYHRPVKKNSEFEDTYSCSGCDRLYRVNCPGTILTGGDPIVAEADEEALAKLASQGWG